MSCSSNTDLDEISRRLEQLEKDIPSSTRHSSSAAQPIPTESSNHHNLRHHRGLFRGNNNNTNNSNSLSYDDEQQSVRSCSPNCTFISNNNDINNIRMAHHPSFATSSERPSHGGSSRNVRSPQPTAATPRMTLDFTRNSSRNVSSRSLGATHESLSSSSSTRRNRTPSPPRGIRRGGGVGVSSNEGNTNNRRLPLGLNFRGSGRSPTPHHLNQSDGSASSSNEVTSPPNGAASPSRLDPHHRRGSSGRGRRILTEEEVAKKYEEIRARSGILKLPDPNGSGSLREVVTSIDQLVEKEHLGSGAYGHVYAMQHRVTGDIIAVKKMNRTGNTQESKRIIMDLDVILKSHDCPYIVRCLGYFITDTEVWICMEKMDSCFGKLLRKIHLRHLNNSNNNNSDNCSSQNYYSCERNNIRRGTEYIPEMIIGKLVVATVKALDYLKEKHGVIHRDIKPSNILIDRSGSIKLCDFGISGRLVDSKAFTRDAGCAGYLSPERINPPGNKQEYDIRADVWALGISLVELATGTFPYKKCSTEFEMCSNIMSDAPPRLPKNEGFSEELMNFVKICLIKECRLRPKYRRMDHHHYHSVSSSSASSSQRQTNRSSQKFITSTSKVSTQSPPKIPPRNRSMTGPSVTVVAVAPAGHGDSHHHVTTPPVVPPRHGVSTNTGDGKNLFGTVNAVPSSVNTMNTVKRTVGDLPSGGLPCTSAIATTSPSTPGSLVTYNTSDGLLKHPFFLNYEDFFVDVGSWYRSVVD